MFLTKTFARNGSFAIFDRANKIFFQNNNLILLGEPVRQNIGG